MTPEDRGKLIGGVVGGVLGSAAVLAAVIFLLRRRKRLPSEEDARGLKSSLDSDVPPTLPPIPQSPRLSLDDVISRPSLGSVPELPELRSSPMEELSFTADSPSPLGQRNYTYNHTYPSR